MAVAVSRKAFQGEKHIGSKLNLSFLRDVIRRRRMSTSALAHKTGIPKATMRRFVNGRTQKPNFQLIQDVSKCLNMDMSCLFAVSKKNDTLNKVPAIALSPSKVPVLEWNEIEQWVAEGIDRTFLINKKWINTNHRLNSQAFALQSTAAMELYVPAKSAIIINPQGELADQKLALVSTNREAQPTIYKALAYEAGFYLKPLLEESNTKRLIRLTPETSIIGTLEEAVVFL